ncbi:MAG: hypothetical protein J6S14_15535 [Clostridia bacterium]|nr:hypothetical protein [Clostridia bacterium]
MKNTMENIRRWFENDYENYDIAEYDGNLEAKTNIVRYLIVSPHSGTDNRWMLRVTTMSAFDRWANSTVVEEFFGTEIELCLYLYDHQLDIYKNLLEYLSLEYEEATK